MIPKRQKLIFIQICKSHIQRHLRQDFLGHYTVILSGGRARQLSLLPQLGPEHPVDRSDGWPAIRRLLGQPKAGGM